MDRPSSRALPAAAAAALLLPLLLAAAPGAADAQDSMSFDVEDTQPRAFVHLAADGGVGKKERAAILRQIEDFVAGDGTYALLSEREAKAAAGRKGWAAFTRCKDTACYLAEARGFGLDRLILVTLGKEDGATTADIELNDVITERVINYTVAVTDTPGDLAFLDKPLDELLHGQNDVGAPTAPEAPPASASFAVTEPVRPQDDGPGFSLTPTWAYVTWAGAGALLVAGGLFGVLASGAQDELQKNPKPRAEVDQLILDGEANQSLANTFFISAAGLAAVGGLLYWLSDEPPEDDRSLRRRLPSASLDLLIAPTAVGVQLRY